MHGPAQTLFLLGALGILVLGNIWDANFTSLCETVRARQIEANKSGSEDPTLVCGQSYSPDKPPAIPLRISLTQCRSENPGWEKSKFDKPAEWAGPLFSFLIPALGFVITIPLSGTLRSMVPGTCMALGHWYWWPKLVFILVALVADTLLGMAIVFGWAGPFIAGAIHEVLVECAIMEELRDRLHNRLTKLHRRGRAGDNGEEWFALAIALVGAFKPTPELVTAVQTQISTPADSAAFLKCICLQLYPFSQLVGVPLMFYLGAFIYGLVDANARLGDNDTAHALAFGLWYFVIVLVAVISSTVLGAVTPSNIKLALQDRAPAPEKLQQQWLSKRHSTLTSWAHEKRLDGSYLLDRKKYRDVFGSRRRPFFASLLAVVTIAVPCGLAIAVSYLTPEIGLSCRSVTVLAYFLAQAWLIILWFFGSLLHGDGGGKCLKRAVSAFYAATGATAVVIALAGAILQLVGVYRNCICKAGLRFGLPTTPSEWVTTATVLLSSDTAEAREAARLWIWLGMGGIIWVGMICLAGAVYRIRARGKCVEFIDDLLAVSAKI